MRAAPRGDQGSVLLLTVGLVVVLVMLIGVLAGASQVFLAKRSLAAATDAAALAGAQAVDLDAVYRGRPASGEGVPLDRREVRRAVAEHVERSALDQTFADFAVVAVEVDDDLVTVRTRAWVALVLVSGATGGRSGVVVEAEASARSRVR